PITVGLNSVFLFVVMLYVYPMKFVFTLFIAQFTGLQPSMLPDKPIRPEQIGNLFFFYGAGFSVTFITLGAMYWWALRNRDAMELNELEQRLSRLEIARCIGLAGVGVVSIVLGYLLPVRLAGLAGFAYLLISVVEGMLGTRMSRAREAMAKP